MSDSEEPVLPRRAGRRATAPVSPPTGSDAGSPPKRRRGVIDDSDEEAELQRGAMAVNLAASAAKLAEDVAESAAKSSGTKKARKAVAAEGQAATAKFNMRPHTGLAFCVTYPDASVLSTFLNNLKPLGETDLVVKKDGIHVASKNKSGSCALMASLTISDPDYVYLAPGLEGVKLSIEVEQLLKTLKLLQQNGPMVDLYQTEGAPVFYIDPYPTPGARGVATLTVPLIDRAVDPPKFPTHFVNLTTIKIALQEFQNIVHAGKDIDWPAMRVELFKDASKADVLRVTLSSVGGFSFRRHYSDVHSETDILKWIDQARCEVEAEFGTSVLLELVKALSTGKPVKDEIVAMTIVDKDAKILKLHVERTEGILTMDLCFWVAPRAVSDN